MTTPTAAEQELADQLVLEHLIGEALASHITGWRAEHEVASVARLSVDFVIKPPTRATGAISGLASIVVAAVLGAGLQITRKP